MSGVSIAVSEPALVAERWGHVLGVPVTEEERPLLRLDGADVDFVEATGKSEEGLVEIAIEIQDDAGGQIASTELAGVLLHRRASR